MSGGGGQAPEQGGSCVMQVNRSFGRDLLPCPGLRALLETPAARIGRGAGRGGLPGLRGKPHGMTASQRCRPMERSSASLVLTSLAMRAAKAEVPR
jgi:hypothetical protein